MARITVRLRASVMVLVLASGLAGCATQGAADDGSCGDRGIAFVLTKQPMSAQDMAKATAAMDMVLAELGFTQSHDVVGHFDAITPTAAVRYLYIEDWRSFEYKDGKKVDPDLWGLHLQPYGACGDKARSERDDFMSSIKAKIEAALQPYATEKVVGNSTIEITVD